MNSCLNPIRIKIYSNLTDSIRHKFSYYRIFKLKQIKYYILKSNFAPWIWVKFQFQILESFCGWNFSDSKFWIWFWNKTKSKNKIATVRELGVTSLIDHDRTNYFTWIIIYLRLKLSQIRYVWSGGYSSHHIYSTGYKSTHWAAPKSTPAWSTMLIACCSTTKCSCSQNTLIKVKRWDPFVSRPTWNTWRKLCNKKLAPRSQIFALVLC